MLLSWLLQFRVLVRQTDVSRTKRLKVVAKLFATAIITRGAICMPKFHTNRRIDEVVVFRFLITDVMFKVS